MVNIVLSQFQSRRSPWAGGGRVLASKVRSALTCQ
ncbi:MAG: hypothetical protein QOC98_1054 [Frankiaceae bacterium]|jgi:hypothetical protein|nr:hypothetical protein [Frankiaceae bacterium]